ncbi:DUF202 domain-containing protein, partial [Sphaerisporangium sp. NPDC005288]|uniref:DUF202 domain-containing protein n=1 Tax=Sphaerisporangium sp. NPDC005288 TaxID=3155114 RepID=UPI0033A603D8
MTDDDDPGDRGDPEDREGPDDRGNPDDHGDPVTRPGPRERPGLHSERTLLAWIRTGTALAAGGLGAAGVAGRHTGDGRAAVPFVLAALCGALLLARTRVRYRRGGRGPPPGGRGRPGAGGPGGRGGGGGGGGGRRPERRGGAPRGRPA